MAIVETSHWDRDSLSSLTSSAAKRSSHNTTASDEKMRNYFVVSARAPRSSLFLRFKRCEMKTNTGMERAEGRGERIRANEENNIVVYLS